MSRSSWIPLVLVAGSLPALAQVATLQLSPLQIQCSAPVQGDPAPQQIITVTASPAAIVSFTVQTSTGASDATPPAWLRVTPARTATPARLSVTCDPGTLATGTYAGRILVTPVQTQYPTIIPVTFEVQNLPPHMELSTNVLRYVQGGDATAGEDQAFLVRNSGGGGALDYTVARLTPSPWITAITPAQGRATPGQTGRVIVSATAAGLRPGAYRGLLRVGWSGGAQDVAVSLFVPPSGPVIEVAPNGAQFEIVQGQGSGQTRALSVINRSAHPLSFIAEVTGGAAWLSLNNADAAGRVSGTVAAGQVSSVVALVGGRNLAAGVSYGLIRITAPGAANSPKTVPVALNVLPAATAPPPVPTPSGLILISKAGAVSATQPVRILVSSQQPVGYYVSASTEDGANWVSARPSSGQTSFAAPAALDVTADATSLKPGVYRGALNIWLGQSEIRTVNLTYIVLPASATYPASDGSRDVAGCTPARLVPTSTGLVASFSTAAGWPVPLAVIVRDDCTDLVAGGQVTIQFSNGDPAVTLRPTLPGTYVGTWAPRNGAGAVTMKITATAANFPAASVEVAGGVRANKAPVLAENGTLNNLNPLVGGALAPGAVVQVFGAELASQTKEPGQVPLLTTFDGTTVLIGGVQAPLYFVSPGQINVQIPSELAANRQYQILVSANGAFTVPDTITVAPAQPGVAAFADGKIIAQHGDFRLITAGEPAAPNEPIVIYLVGMGATDPAVASGQPAPAAPLAQTLNRPVVTVDGKPCEVFFSGLTPGAVGLYQINFRVPADAKPGDLEVVVTHEGVAANRTVLPVK